MDKVKLDFENNIVEWETDGQKGTEHCPDLHERKAEILAAMGYEQYDISGVVDIVNAFANGRMTIDQLEKQLETEKIKEGMRTPINECIPENQVNWDDEPEITSRKDSNMTTGYLWYNVDEKRYGVIDASDLWEIDGLHCGACMEALVNDKWLPVRLEYNASAHELSRGWYLVGYDSDKLDGLRVRMS